MTASPDARTLSASVHALSGSSRPGTDTASVSLAALQPSAAPGVSASDAEVIDLAERAAALARREDTAWLRRSRLDDHLERIGPKHPTRKTEMGTKVVLEYPLSTLRGDLKRHEDLPDIEDWLNDTRVRIAAMERYEHTWAALERRYGVPRLQRRIRRMHRRLVRWGTRLTAMEPTTNKGLAAKAAVAVALEKIDVEEAWASSLAASISRDAVRVASLPAGLPSIGRDDELLRLQGEWEASGARCMTLSRAADAAHKRMSNPPVPDALRFQAATDASFIGAYQNRDRRRPHGYTDPAQIDQLRRGGAAAHQARRDEIVSAFDAWQAAVQADKDASGYTAADAAWTAEIDRNNEIERQIARTSAFGREGLAAKMDVALWGCQNDDGIVTDDEIVGEIEYRISRGVDKQSAALPWSILRDLKCMLRGTDIDTGGAEASAPAAARAA